MTIVSKPLTDEEIERMAREDVPNLVAVLKTALEHLDLVITAYCTPGIGRLMVACRLAKEWRGVVCDEEEDDAG